MSVRAMPWARSGGIADHTITPRCAKLAADKLQQLAAPGLKALSDGSCDAAPGGLFREPRSGS